MKNINSDTQGTRPGQANSRTRNGFWPKQSNVRTSLFWSNKYKLVFFYGRGGLLCWEGLKKALNCVLQTFLYISRYQFDIRKGVKKNPFFLGLCPKQWVDGGQKSETF